jgi:cardiolipin synthase A/B
MNRLRFSARILFAVSLAFSAATASAGKNKPVAGDRFFTTPNAQGYVEIIEGINSAKKSIFMQIFRLSNDTVADALIAAQKRGVEVTLIGDPKAFDTGHVKELAEKMRAAGVNVRRASDSFSITHSKAMVIDETTAYVTSMNLTSAFNKMRDYGVITKKPGIVKEMLKVFHADLENADKGLGKTPALQEDDLMWSPVNSEIKLKSLIDSAQKSVVSEVENLSNPAVQAAFVAAEARGVDVKIILPMCNLSSGPDVRNYIFLNELRAAGAETRVMPGPSDANLPYMHGKMIMVDYNRVYLGSINFSINSITKARELGILSSEKVVLDGMSEIFLYDWQVSKDAPESMPESCRAKTPSPLADDLIQ